MVTRTIGSADYCYSEHDAYISSMHRAKAEFLSGFSIISSKTEAYYCDGCGDYHYDCTLTVQIPEPVESDLAVKLKALGFKSNTNP